MILSIKKSNIFNGKRVDRRETPTYLGSTTTRQNCKMIQKVWPVVLAVVTHRLLLALPNAALAQAAQIFYINDLKFCIFIWQTKIN